jgi:hypothetical protein
MLERSTGGIPQSAFSWSESGKALGPLAWLSAEF